MKDITKSFMNYLSRNYEGTIDGKLLLIELEYYSKKISKYYVVNTAEEWYKIIHEDLLKNNIISYQ